jgi:HEAT repeat protein
MKAQLCLLGAACLLAGCAKPPAGPAGGGPLLPPLPPLALRSQLVELKALAQSLVPPDAAEQRELRDLGDLALQLVDADARTLARAERALCEHPHAWWILEPALAHERIEVRRRAAWLCGNSGQTVLQLALLLRLKYELDPETVVWVADALARLGNDTGLGWIDAAIPAAATAEQAGACAIAALRARGVELGEAPTWAELRAGLQEHYGRWLARGESALPGIAPPPAAQLEPRLATHFITTEGTLLRPVDDARFVLTRAGRLAVPFLARALTASEPYLRTMSLQVLAELGTAAVEAAPAVLPLLADPLTGSYAVRTLGEMQHAPALPWLRPLLASPDTELRAAATLALGLLRDEASRDGLRARLADASELPDVRVNAAFALRCLGPDEAADAFLAERQARKDYHEPTLNRLLQRLAALRR